MWFSVTFSMAPDVKHRICAQLRKMTNAFEAKGGLLIVDLGHNGGLSGEASYPWREHSKLSAHVPTDTSL